MEAQELFFIYLRKSDCLDDSETKLIFEQPLQADRLLNYL